MPMGVPIPAEMRLMGAMPCCFGLFFLIGGGLILTDAARQYLVAQRIRNTPTSKARGVAVGLVELSGKAKCPEMLVSPITKTPSAYYEVIAQYYYHTKNSSGWRAFYRDVSAKRFYLEDDTGKVLIEPKGADISIPADFTFQGTLNDRMFFGLLPSNQVDKKVLEYLEQNPKAKEAAKHYSGRQLRFLEYDIAEGDALYVLGSAETLEGAASTVSSENLIVRKNGRDKIMMISDSSEKQLLTNLSIRFYLEAFFGSFMVFFALIAMLFAGFFLV